MQFINTVTGTYPVSLADLRAAHPLTLFPSDFAEEFGDFKPVLDVPMPAHDPLTHRAQEQPPVLSEGSYRQAWEVVALTPEESAAARRALVPASVTRRQARQALLLAGKLDDVPLAIAAIEDDTERRMAEIEWQDATDFERDRPLVVAIAHAIGLSESELDQLFIDAAGL